MSALMRLEMALLHERDGQRSCVLEAEHLVGRGPQCSLQLRSSRVSAQHGLIRWNGARWELIDRGSRNGTWLNGTWLEAGKPYPLELGASIAFGDAKQPWKLVDVSPPVVMVVAVGEDSSLLGADGVIGVPSADDPLSTLYRDLDGVWKLERPDQPTVPLYNGDVFEIAGRIWRFCQPNSVDPTLTAEPSAVQSFPTAHFSVSRDEEFVSLVLEYPDRHAELGSRAHNYLLLTLARARLEDQSDEVPESSCGWMYKETLAEKLGTAATQVDGEVFRIRKHLGQRKLDEAASIIERRPRTTQLRFGIPRIRITLL